jgi:phage shock protein C
METPPKKLYRLRTNKKVAGVCGGIAEYLNQDPTVIRVITAILILSVGIGLLAYLACWVLIPVNPSG